MTRLTTSLKFQQAHVLNKANATMGTISRPSLIVSVLLFGAFASLDVSAAVDLNSYRQSRTAAPETRELINSYMFGLRDGIVLFDAYNQRYEGEKQKFCIIDANLTGEKTLAILDVEIADPSKRTPYPDDIPIVLVLINALKRFVSCK